MAGIVMSFFVLGIFGSFANAKYYNFEQKILSNRNFYRKTIAIFSDFLYNANNKMKSNYNQSVNKDAERT